MWRPRFLAHPVLLTDVYRLLIRVDGMPRALWSCDIAISALLILWSDHHSDVHCIETNTLTDCSES